MLILETVNEPFDTVMAAEFVAVAVKLNVPAAFWFVGSKVVNVIVPLAEP